MDSLFVCTIDRLLSPLRGAASNASAAPCSVVYSSCSLSSVLSFYRSLSKKAVRGGLESRVLRSRRDAIRVLRGRAFS